MSMSPMAYADSLRIGTIDFVAPDEIKVLLDIEAPDNVALNTGTPRPFPRINGYVLIPSDEGYLVAQVEWITVERSQFPKRQGMQDFGLIDLPYPLRKMSLNPIGSLLQEDEDKFSFRRGVDSYPTVGSPVLLPTQNQLRSIVESGTNKHVKIGVSPLAANASVCVDPDRLFGRHLAVLGNTGSGKSCSVAGLIRWSLQAARKAREGGDPNARFIVLDPNGEYANTFKDLGNVRIFSVEGDEEQGVQALKVPMWFWNSEEWSAFTQASPRAQRPTLVQALRSVRDGSFEHNVTPSNEMRRYLRTLVGIIQQEKSTGRPWSGPGPVKGFVERLASWQDALKRSNDYSANENKCIRGLYGLINEYRTARRADWPGPFTKAEIDELLNQTKAAHSVFGGSDTDILPIDADVPREFSGADFLRSLEVNAEQLNVSDYVETMLMRVRTLLGDSRMKSVSGETDGLSLTDWLENYIGASNAANGSITVIDLSLLPVEVVHLVTAVIARMTLEALQRYRKNNHGKILPTALVMEEAHTFIKRYNADIENQSSAAICCQVFEKIAREGRKYGLGLVLSSQRPSELSPTVLSQCNSFLLHRISNDRDQELVHRLVPDNLRGLLRDLPSLPSRHAILMGWASELPVLVQMNSLAESERPTSEDPDFWNVWSGSEELEDGSYQDIQRPVDWDSISRDWQERNDNGESS
ncbi:MULTISPECIES: ATP-binding protein [Halomonadaceae]|uniref:ATP-binding protein n=1 Tax=Halomonadaceae TaxID=28256 RepID=UPI0004E2D36B|nr:ATP-binding protein [Halomonas sp. KO116]AJY50829.1 protein of unknown function DUF87 [Halomonas sp. KO116]